MAYQPKSVGQLEVDKEVLTERCIKQGHLNKDDDLIELIKKDLKSVEELGFDKKVFIDFFSLLKESFATLEMKSKRVKIPMFIQQHYSKFNTQGWCSWGNNCYKIQLHDKSFDVFKFTWGGAEQCPILTNYDESYHGYSWGSHDWFFRDKESKEWFFVPDLFPLQFSNYGFAQSGQYRTNPVKLINFLGLKKDQDYISNRITKQKWDVSSSSSHLLDKEKDKLEEAKVVFDNDSVTIYDMYDYIYKKNMFVAISKTDSGIDCIFKSLPLKSTMKVNKFDKVPKSFKVYKNHNLDNYSFEQNLEFYDMDGPDACIVM